MGDEYSESNDFSLDTSSETTDSVEVADDSMDSASYDDIAEDSEIMEDIPGDVLDDPQEVEAEIPMTDDDSGESMEDFLVSEAEENGENGLLTDAEETADSDEIAEDVDLSNSEETSEMDEVSGDALDDPQEVEAEIPMTNDDSEESMEDFIIDEAEEGGDSDDYDTNIEAEDHKSDSGELAADGSADMKEDNTERTAEESGADTTDNSVVDNDDTLTDDTVSEENDYTDTSVDEATRGRETYDYETSPEMSDSSQFEKIGEFAPRTNNYDERWDELKDVPFAGDETKDDAKVLKRDEIDLLREGNNAINRRLEAQEDDYRDKGLSDQEIEEKLREDKISFQKEFLSDAFPGQDISTNVFNGFTENGSRDTIRDMEGAADSSDDVDDDWENLKEVPFVGDIEDSTDTGADYDDLSDERDNGDIEDAEMFGSFETDQHINGSDYFVKGDNYDRFKDDYYSVDDSVYEKYETPEEKIVSPSMIEGIHLGKTEMENPDVFWSQHENGGTADSFREIAEQIPEVNERLEAGETIDSLIQDPELSKCASIYFDKKPKVIENDGYYEFDSNGRHRILAAREAGCDIPVDVIGRRGKSIPTVHTLGKASTESLENNGYQFKRNDEGQLLHASGDLKLKNGIRDQKGQMLAGREDRRKSDDGGHLIGTRFDGPGGEEYLIPQDRHVNRSGYKALEDEWAYELNNENDVHVEISPIYHENSRRPDVVEGSYTVSDGNRSQTEYFSMTNENLESPEFSFTDDESQFPNAMDTDYEKYENEIDENLKIKRTEWKR